MRAVVIALMLAVLAPVPRPAAAVEVERVVSPGGIEAWLVRDHTNPIIAVRLAFRGGAALDPPGREGLATMVSALLDEGAGDLDSQAFRERLDGLAVTLRYEAGRDHLFGRLRTLTENRDAAFDLLRLSLTAPRFDDEPVARIRNQILSLLRQESTDPGVIAGRTLSRTLFPDHPYGRPIDGTPEAVTAVTVDDLRRFTARHLARDRLVIGVVGDIRPADLGLLLDSTFGALPATGSAAPIAEARPVTDGAVGTVDLAVPQSSIRFAQAGVKRDDPDFYAAYVLNHILGGGGFTSRLYAEVREERGLAYSVGSWLIAYDRAAVIRGNAGTANARAAETIAVVRAEWRRMQADGVTPEELADAKTFLTGSFPLRFSSSGRIARILMSMQLDDLGIDYLDRRNGLIEAVTLDDVNRLARELLDPQALTFVVVGQPEGLTVTD